MENLNSDPMPAHSHDAIDINKSTWVRVGSVTALVVPLAMGYFWLDTRFQRLEKAMEDTTRRIEAASSDRFTRTDARLLLYQLGKDNPTLQIPDDLLR